MKLVSDPDGWREVMAELPDHDFYHTWDYHEDAFERGLGEPLLFDYQVGAARIALPVLIRLGAIGGHSYRDATSVYGYAGPVASDKEVWGSHASGFRRCLREHLASLGLVSIFSRLHPLIDVSTYLHGLGCVSPVSSTVAIDLTMSEEEQWHGYRSNMRRDVAALRASNLSCERSGLEQDYGNFLEIYNRTMREKGAGDFYLLDADGLARLRNARDFRTNLFVCRAEGIVVAGALFIQCGGVIQYHLSGSHPQYRKLAPTKLIIDNVRRWAKAEGCHTFHLGGGVGGSNDSLLRFKRGFSRQMCVFRLWKWILDQGAYDELVRKHLDAAEADDARLCEGFFPEYRAPLTRA